MTNDYKERIIKWLTGNYTIEQSSTEPLFQNLEETTIGLSTLIDEMIGYVQGKDGKGNDLDIGFIYGNKDNKGVILIVDNDFNIIQDITEYDTGTDFHEFICLNVDSTNGNVYGIDKQGSQYRFILLNNFMVKTPAQEYYEVKLRNSYFITFTNNTFIPQFIDKKPTEALYLMFGTYTDSSSGDNLSQPAIATYKVEVGSTNELNMYFYTNADANGRSFFLKAYNIIWSDQTYSVQLNGYTWYQVDPQYLSEIYYKEFSFDETTITLEKSIELSYTYTNEDEFNSNSSFIINNEGSYLILFETAVGYGATKLYKVSDNSLVSYETLLQETVLETKIGGGRLFKKNNQLFYFMYINTTESSNPKNIEFTIEFGAITNLNGTPYITKKIFEEETLYDLLYENIIFNVSNVYNLHTYNIIGAVPEGFSTNTALRIKQIFNPLNYNYEDYQNINSLVPKSVWLYSDNEIVFARNLYNKTLNGNITVSTIEVPNMLLNDISITPQKLLGGTNGILINSTESITKNIYEDLFINFYNELTMQNQNNPIFIPNLLGATRLNSSISQIMDYSSAKLNKIRINYSDDTTFIKTINPATRISQFVYQFKFNVYVPSGKTITSIELISNDEGTVYQTIENLSLASSKSYDITQNVEIGE